MIIDYAGGHASDLVQAGEVPDDSRAYHLDPARVKSLVGMDISEDIQLSLIHI